MSTALRTGSAPVLPAYRAVTQKGEQLLKVWCSYCKSFHIHGGISEEFGAGDGHRVAHCWRNDSPYRMANGGRGYVLREVGPLTAEARRAAKRGQHG